MLKYSKQKKHRLTNKSPKRQKMLQYRIYVNEPGWLAYLVKVLATKHEKSEFNPTWWKKRIQPPCCPLTSAGVPQRTGLHMSTYTPK